MIKNIVFLCLWLPCFAIAATKDQPKIIPGAHLSTLIEQQFTSRDKDYPKQRKNTQIDCPLIKQKLKQKIIKVFLLAVHISFLLKQNGPYDQLMIGRLQKTACKLSKLKSIHKLALKLANQILFYTQLQQAMLIDQ